LKHKRKTKKNPHNTEKTTFDPRIHHKGAGTGYGLKRDHVQTPAETSGAQLASILGIK
jgi:hypothetical protein